jgi:hypothetical protein
VAGQILDLARKRWPDKLARLRDGFYKVKGKDGRIVPFCMNEDQEKFLLERHGMDLVLKARQKGFTTVIQLDMLDDCLFVPNTSCGVIAHNLADAKAFFADKIKFAYDKLPQEFRKEIAAAYESEKFDEQDAADSMKFSNGSSLRVGTSLRSGTLQRLHVSEYGKLCAKYPEKAREVKSGAFNTVQAGQSITVESTAEGQSGDFYEMCKKAQAKRDQGEPLTALDFKFHFSPWFTSSEYRLDPDGVLITAEMKQYFAKVEDETGTRLDDWQRAWYVKKAEQQGDDMKREYPSTANESFEASIEGAYFTTQMRKVRKEGRICRIPILDAPVYTTWDLGYDDSMTITFWQDVGMERRAIDYYENSGEGFGHYAAVLREKGYTYTEHYMPHDAEHHMLNVEGTTRKQEAEKAGIAPVRVLKRISTELDGIEATRRFLPNVYIDEERCSRLIWCLDNYRKDFDDKHGVYKSKARHGEESHGYKSMETAAIRPEAAKSKKLDLTKLKRLAG